MQAHTTPPPPPRFGYSVHAALIISSELLQCEQQGAEQSNTGLQLKLNTREARPESRTAATIYTPAPPPGLAHVCRSRSNRPMFQIRKYSNLV